MNTKTEFDFSEVSTIENDPEYQHNLRNLGSIIWRRLASGLKIIDLLPIHFEAVLDIVLNCYVTENVVFKNTNFLKDPESIEAYKERLLVCMRDRCSIIAVKEDNDEIVGILLLKTVRKADCGRVFSKTGVNSGTTYSSIVKFINAMQRKVDVYDLFKCDKYLRFYLVCITPEYRRQRIGFQMMICGLDVARYHEILVVMGIMDSHKLQDNCRKLGFVILCETTYKKYHDEDQQLIFCDCGMGNYSCALMAGKVPPDIEPEPAKKVTVIDSPKKKKKGAKGKKK